MPNRAEILRARRDCVGAAEWQARLPVLRAQTLTLRELVPSDAPSLARWLRRRDAWQFTERLPECPAGFEWFIGWLDRERRAGRSLCFGIVPLGLRDAVGFVLIRRLDVGFHAGRCAFALGEPFYDIGLLAPAAEVALDYTIRRLRPQRIEVRTWDARESQVLEALGAVREGVLRGTCHAGGEPVDATLWSMLRDEWTASRRRVTYNCCPPSSESPRVPDGRATPADDPALARPRWGSVLPVLAGEGLTLREVEAADAAHLLRVLSPQDIRAFIDPPPLTEKLFRQYIAWAIRERELGRAACYAVVVGADPAPGGLVQVRQVDPTFVTAEWGIVFAAALRGSGLFSRVTRLLLDFLFETVGVSRLEAQTTRQNLAALGSLRAAGGAREAVLRRVSLIDNQSVVQELWAILRQDWRRAGFRPD